LKIQNCKDEQWNKIFFSTVTRLRGLYENLMKVCDILLILFLCTFSLYLRNDLINLSIEEEIVADDIQ